MKKITAYLVSFAALTLFVNAAVPILPASILPRIESAQAAQGGPSEFKVGIGDEGCGSQHREYGSAIYTNPTGEDRGYVTDENGKDPDCARIYLNPGDTAISGGSMYTNDFRIGIALSESENGCTDRKSAVSYTPWASEGGGDAFNRAVGSIDAADCIWIHYQTRPMPGGGVRVINAQAGISVGGGALRYTPWASQGGGWSSYSTTGGGDFTSARVVLNTQLNYKYNAAYGSTTIPQNPPNSLTKNLAYTNQNIVMKNIPDVGASTAMPWVSDQEVSSTTNRGVAHCYEWTPSSGSDTCTQTTVYSSSKFKLRRIDNNTAAVVTTGGDLSYRRTVVSQYGASQVWYEGECYPSGGGGGTILINQKEEKKTLSNAFGLIKSADAREIDPGPGEEICDPPYPSNPPEYNASYISQDQPANVLTNQNATFDNLTVTGTQDGTYQLQYQMVNTETNELFGDPNASGNSNTIARINVRIGAWGLNCTATATTIAGQPVNFAVNATGTPPASVNVTMTNTPPPGPTNAVMTNSPLTLNSSNSYAGVAVVSTTGLQPGTYPLVFNGSGSDGSSVSCNSSLQVLGGVAVTSNQSNLAIYQNPSLQFTVNGGTSATIPANSSATLSWTTSATNSGNVGVASGNWSGNDKSCTPGIHTQSIGPLAVGEYTYSITCPGALGSWSTIQTVTVTATSPPEQPQSAVTSNVAAGCGVITIQWQRSTGGVTPTAFRVFRRASETDSWQQLGADIPYAGQGASHVFSTQDNSPLNPAGSNYYSVTSVYNSSQSGYAIANPYPIVPEQCDPKINDSDKDVVSVDGLIDVSYEPVQLCTNNSEPAELPGNALFTVGDIITFQLNVCNSGNEELTGVTVTDTYSNLSNVTYLSSNPANCASVSGTGSNSITFSVPSVPAPTNTQHTACSIRMTGVVTAPSNPSAAIYFFQNRALISANGGTLTKEVYTPPYRFSVTGRAPNRGETAPQPQ